MNRRTILLTASLAPLLAAPHFTLMNSDELARPFRSQRFLYAAAIVGGGAIAVWWTRRRGSTIAL